MNITFLEEQYKKYKNDSQSVSREWQIFFNGFDVGYERGPAGPPAAAADGGTDAHVAELIQRYRDLGHLLACMDPLSACPTEHPLLSLEAFGFKPDDLAREFATPQFGFIRRSTLKEIIKILKQTYCRSIGVEYMHLQDPDERRWLQDRMEPVRNQPELDKDTQLRLLEKLTQAAVLEQFLNKKYVAVTRFSLEGGDGVIPLLDTMLERIAGLGGREVILGMAHRGRLNVQANILNKPPEDILAEFETCYDSSQLSGAGDVKYHNGYMSDLKLPGGAVITALLVNNPSHLEAVDPVVEGIARARQEMAGEQGEQKVVPVLLHGDAGFAGQGVVAETLNMSQLEGYHTGGTVHVIINNQIGYTTLPQDARSTRYSTDLAKMLMVPVFHVHGEDPEALAHVIRLAVDYRYAFGKDVVVDVVCYRRYGHNEGDEPYFTQPLMYDRIHERPSPHKLYADKLMEAGTLSAGDLEKLEAKAAAPLEKAYDEVHGSACPFPQPRFFENWEAFSGRYTFDAVETAVARETLLDLSRSLNSWPETFKPHPKIKLLLQRRRSAVEKGEGLDWANAENLAFASLLREGLPVRLSGQDSGRGTFSQRHSVLFDRKDGHAHMPLNSLGPGAAAYTVYNSLLAEAGVLGFEYGYAVTQPLGLTIWEAQFGDFVNNAQGVIDLFIASGQVKWQRLCGLTMLLPHGWEGLGPEHSSARLERFLQLCAGDNIQVCDLTTPAQYFHLLRRQARATYRKPLVLMTPKSLLRHPRAVSTLEALSRGTFQPVLDDPARPLNAGKVLLCSGKIYYQLLQRREDLNSENVAIVRLEQYYPFPGEKLKAILKDYAKAHAWVWVQEAPRNMGGWQYVKTRLEELGGPPLSCVSRPPSSSPATGFPNIYKQQQETISDQAIGHMSGGRGMAG
ncbi:MAG: 2-oxoglutarate dehydrogenase E1 component [Desulfosarcinaceae bacterium]